VSASTGASATGSPRMATAADGPLVTRILVDAFHDDPMWGSWAFPDPHTRQQGRVAVFGLLVEGAMRYPWVWLAADDAATAVWIPPGGSELSPAQEQQIDSVLLESLGSRAASVLEAFEMFAEARPTEPHYYLTLLGTDPAHHGRGVGQRLLAANLGQVDAAGAPAYLEAGDELVPLYERFGFRTLKRFALTDGPTVNGMWREPRADGPGGAVRRPRRP
jgi:GNAT superfamily N-acetyltransferase